MARITRVARAQQRYATKPVIDPATGEQKIVAVMDTRTGEPKVSKRGAVTRRLTERDLSKPLPMPQCDYPKCDHPTKEIKVGEPYMHITPKSGPYGGSTRYRHGDHPSWNVWEYSYSTSARVAQVQHDIADMLSSYDFTTEGDFDDACQQAAEMAAELRDEKEEALNNMPEGLQEGSVASEQFDALSSWVDEIESASAPSWDDTCPECDGTGECTECDGTGTLDQPDADWAEEARAAIMDAVENCYV
jgi:hypothetical protein